jgi:prephenate dehydratase
MRIAFQGEHGAYSEGAIFEHFGDDLETIPCQTFEDVFAAVSENKCECGFIPIENSLAGSIHRNYDLLLQNQLEVVGEHSLRVSHCLIGCPGSNITEIRKAISHPQALAQCEQYLRRMSLISEAVYDTAGSVKIIKDRGDRTVAAIASPRAAELYGMPVLAAQIEDNPANFTRFLIISRQPAPTVDDAKTSIVFSLENRPGAMYRALSVFALRDLDLTKLESRPLAGKPWEYFFYIDFIGSIQDTTPRNALNNLAEFATFLRVLGSYPRWRPPTSE